MEIYGCDVHKVFTNPQVRQVNSALVYSTQTISRYILHCVLKLGKKDGKLKDHLSIGNFFQF